MAITNIDKDVRKNFFDADQTPFTITGTPFTYYPSFQQVDNIEIS